MRRNKGRLLVHKLNQFFEILFKCCWKNVNWMKWLNEERKHSKAFSLFFLQRKSTITLYETSIRDHSNAVVKVIHTQAQWLKCENFIGHLSLTIMHTMSESTKCRFKVLGIISETYQSTNKYRMVVSLFFVWTSWNTQKIPYNLNNRIFWTV